MPTEALLSAIFGNNDPLERNADNQGKKWLSVERVAAIAILGFLLCSCHPFKGVIINETGEDIYLVVRGRNQHNLSAGRIPGGSALNIDQELNAISVIYYRTQSGESCELGSRAVINTADHQDREIWRIHLRRCKAAQLA